MSNTQIDNTEGLTLFAILLGCKPKGRNVEQHDVMFAVAKNLNELTDSIKDFWYTDIIAEVNTKIKKLLPGIDSAQLTTELKSTLSRRDKVHIDAWMTVKYVDGYKIKIHKRDTATTKGDLKLFFINLGGYKENEFEEFHKKLFVVANATSEAIGKIMHVDFMKEYSPENLGIAGSAHLDDQYKIDFEADDIICVSEAIGNDYTIELIAEENLPVNEMNVGYTHLEYPGEG